MSRVGLCTCPLDADQHRRDCPCWEALACECDPLGDGLDHHPWCGQHPCNAERVPHSTQRDERGER